MKALGLWGAIAAAVVMSGCGTGRVSEPEVVSAITTETAVAMKVVETTTVALPPVDVQAASGCGNQVSAGRGVDILQDARKPCSAIAADAPKFVVPEDE